MNRPIAAAVAAALALGGGLAHATATASATLSDLHVQLFSLDASRSGAPSVTFEAGAGSLARVATTSPMTNGQRYASQSSGSPFGATSADAALGPQAGGEAIVTGDPFKQGANLSASAFAATDESSSEATAYVGDGADLTSFTLSAHTLLTISMMADLSVDAAADDYAIGSVQFQLLGAFGDNSQESMANALVAAGSGFGSARTLHELLTVSFFNPYDFAIDGRFFGGADVTTVAAAAPVPEPASVAMLLAALLMLRAFGARLARRRR